jgi:hypothetical protein
MSKIYVIAGNNREGLEWAKKDLARKWWWVKESDKISLLSHYVIVDHVDKIRGVSYPTGYFVGTWKTRSDLRELIKIMQNASYGKNRALQKMYDDLILRAERL